MRRLRFRPGTKYRQGFAARSRCFHRFQSEATGGISLCKKARTSPSNTFLPPAGTAIRSAIVRAAFRSWKVRTMVFPSSLRAAISFRNFAPDVAPGLPSARPARSIRFPAQAPWQKMPSAAPRPTAYRRDRPSSRSDRFLPLWRGFGQGPAPRDARPIPGGDCAPSAAILPRGYAGAAKPGASLLVSRRVAPCRF